MKRKWENQARKSKNTEKGLEFRSDLQVCKKQRILWKLNKKEIQIFYKLNVKRKRSERKNNLGLSGYNRSVWSRSGHLLWYLHSFLWSSHSLWSEKHHLFFTETLALTGVLHSAALNLYSWETLNRANTALSRQYLCQQLTVEPQSDCRNTLYCSLHASIKTYYTLRSLQRQKLKLGIRPTRQKNHTIRGCKL